MRKENVQPNSFLGLVLLFFGMTTINFSLFHGLLQEQLSKYIPYLRLEPLYGLGPALYLYTRSVTNSDYKLRGKDLLLFVPVLLELIYYRTSYYREGAIEIGLGTQSILQQIFIIQQWAGFVYSTTFMLLSVYILFKYKHWIRNNFSYTQNISLEWIHTPILSFVIFWFIWFGVRLTDIMIFSGEYSQFYFFPMIIILSIITLWIGFRGYTNSKIGSIGFDPSLSLKKDTTTNDISAYNEIAETLKSKMESGKYYLNQDLSLKILSVEIGIQENVLSKAINQSLNMNFHEFVNTYRVREFIDRIKKDEAKQFTFLAHAYESGFASKSAFNYIFKKQTQKTPKEYLSQLREKQAQT